MQVKTEIMKLIKNLLKFKQQKITRLTAAIAKLTLIVLNFVSLLSTIDQIILSNLKL